MTTDSVEKLQDLSDEVVYILDIVRDFMIIFLRQCRWSHYTQVIFLEEVKNHSFLRPVAVYTDICFLEGFKLIPFQ